MRPLPAVSIVRRVRGGWVPAEREPSLLLVGRAASRALNARYRGRDRPSNVLSFPAPPGAPGICALLGDLVICPAVLRAEARAQHKSARAHWMHLVVHGVLRLAGYDHERRDDALRMERREIRVLRGLGVANPYRSPTPR